MRILVTNDDGIGSEGLEALVQALRLMTDSKGAPLHDIFVVAPDGERSGVSHAVTLKHPTKVRKLKDGVFTCSGTPADCVIVAGLALMDEKPDIVVSGINRGPNLGTDIIYSGTCGAARQAALSGIPSIAVSCASFSAPLEYGACASFVSSRLEELAAAWRPDTFVNVNGPSSSETALRARWTVPGRNRYHDNLRCFEGADGFTYCFIAEGRHERTFDPLSDHHAVSLGHIAVSLIALNPCAAHEDSLTGTDFGTR